MVSPVTEIVCPDYTPSHRLVRVGHEGAEDSAAKVVGAEVLAEVGRREFDQDCLLVWTGFGELSIVRDAVRGATIENVREEDSGEGFGVQKEADVGFVFPGDNEERVCWELDNHKD